jgi:hypothetical protein
MARRVRLDPRDPIHNSCQYLATRFVVCVRNKGYPASLEARKVYRVLADPEGEKLGLLRVIDEDGEDYLYPRAYFVPIAVGASAARAIAVAS